VYKFRLGCTKACFHCSDIFELLHWIPIKNIAPGTVTMLSLSNVIWQFHFRLFHWCAVVHNCIERQDRHRTTTWQDKDWSGTGQGHRRRVTNGKIVLLDFATDYQTCRYSLYIYSANYCLTWHSFNSKSTNPCLLSRYCILLRRHVDQHNAFITSITTIYTSVVYVNPSTFMQHLSVYKQTRYM